MMKNLTSRFTTNQIILTIAYLAPLVLLIWFVTTFGVNVPFADQLDLVEFFTKVHRGQVSFQDLFAQHNEHRILFPRIILASLAFASGWNNQLEMYFSIGLVVITLALVYAIARQSRSASASFHVSCILCSAYLFSLEQQENWLWGFQVAWFLINLLVIVAIGCLVLPKRYSPRARLWLAGIVCLIASFSSAHGLVVWVALLPLVLTLPGSLRQRLLRGTIWLACVGGLVAIYRIGYVKPGAHPDPLFFLSHPGAALTYLLTLFGFPIRGVSLIRSLVGGCILLNFLVFNVYFFKHHSSAIVQEFAPWLALGWFPILFALMTTLGRAGFGAEQATSSRYISVTVLLFVALIQLWRVYLDHQDDNRRKRIGAMFVSGILVALLLSNTLDVLAKASFSNRAAAKTCLDMVHFLDRSTTPDTLEPMNSKKFCLAMLYPFPAQAVNKAVSLEQMGLRHFPQPGEVTFVSRPPKPYGYIDAPASNAPIMLNPTQPVLTVSGWAAPLNHPPLSELVLFSYDDQSSFFAYSLTEIPRPDVVKALKSERFSKSGWQTQLPLEQLPKGKHTIKAWIYEQRKSRFYELGRELVVIRKA